MRKIKVLFVYPNLQMVMLLPSNIAILAAYLKDHGIEVKLFDTTFYRTEEKSVDDIRVEHMQLRPFRLEEKGVSYKSSDLFKDFVETVELYRPDVIAVSATDDTFDMGMTLVRSVKSNPAHVTVGGVYPSFDPEGAISNELVDSVCIGEGEEALLELCQRIGSGSDISDIPNLWVKTKDGIAKNAIRPLIDINSIPYEDFSIFEEERIYRPMQGKVFRMIPVSLDRGCPYNCSFCAAPAHRKIYIDSGCGAYFRVKTVSRVMDELRHYMDRYDADYIYFNSETFFARKDADIAEFASRYERDIHLPFWCQTRIETITESRVRMLKEMGCDRISIGLEHGNEAFRRDVLKKDFTNDQAVEAFGILKKGGIPVTVNNIIGFPGETREMAFDTIRLNRRISADSINAYFFVPYRGTPLRDICIKRGYISTETKTDSLMRSSVLNMPGFPQDEIKGLVRTFPLYIKMPEEYFEKIMLAERSDEAGDKALGDLRQIYFERYFK